MADPDALRLSVFKIISGNSNCPIELLRGYQELRQPPIGMDDTAIAGMTPALFALLKLFKQSIISIEVTGAKTVSDLVDVMEKKCDEARTARSQKVQASVHGLIATTAGIAASAFTTDSVLRNPPLGFTDVTLLNIRSPLNAIISAYGLAIMIADDQIESFRTVGDVVDFVIKDIQDSDIY